MSGRNRSWVVAFLLAALAAPGCRDETPSEPPPLPSATASETVDTGARTVDPLIIKTYHLDECYVGSFSLKQARAAYLASLHGAEPGPDNIPEFGLADEQPSPAPPSPSASGSTGAPVKSAPPVQRPAPRASASASASAAPRTDKAKLQIDKDRRIRQANYEHLAYMCKQAAEIKEPSTPELDKALEEYRTFALGLAKDLTDASLYFQKEEYKSDGFAKGKEYHTRITAAFKDLDAQTSKLALAVKGFGTSHPLSKGAFTDSQNLSDALVQAGLALYEDLEADKVDVTKAKADLGKLDIANDALAKHTPTEASGEDPFVIIVVPPGKREAQVAHQLLEASEFKTPKPSTLNAMTSYMEQILGGNWRATLKAIGPRLGPLNMGPRQQVRPHLPDGHPVVPPQQ